MKSCNNHRSGGFFHGRVRSHLLSTQDFLHAKKILGRSLVIKATRRSLLRWTRSTVKMSLLILDEHHRKELSDAWQQMCAVLSPPRSLLGVRGVQPKGKLAFAFDEHHRQERSDARRKNYTVLLSLPARIYSEHGRRCAHSISPRLLVHVDHGK